MFPVILISIMYFGQTFDLKSHYLITNKTQILFKVTVIQLLWQDTTVEHAFGHQDPCNYFEYNL